MKFEIKSRWDGIVLFRLETGTMKLAVEAAVKSRADLREANLLGADLREANLREANLREANLLGADLREANLREANLLGADLREANLLGADLREANLLGADLREANLREANLREADLREAKGVDANRLTPLRILLEQPGKIRAYKLVDKKREGPYCRSQGYTAITYEIGKSFDVAGASTDESVQCAAGINLATLDWCMREWRKGYRILIAEFTAEDIAAIPTSTDGKFRVHRCAIVGEKDLTALGLLEEIARGK